MLSENFLQPYRPVGVVVKDTAGGAGGWGFDSRTGKIQHSIAIGSPPLRRFFGAVLPLREDANMDPAARYAEIWRADVIHMNI